MQIHEKYYGDVLVLTLAGKLIGEPETEELHDKISVSIASGHHHLVLDLKKVEWMGSIGFGIITGGLILARSTGGDLRLTGLNGKVAKLLTITKLDGVFQNYKSIQEAVASYKNPSHQSKISEEDSARLP
jgi:anti-sigma B factor antagonist